MRVEGLSEIKEVGHLMDVMTPAIFIAWRFAVLTDVGASEVDKPVVRRDKIEEQSGEITHEEKNRPVPARSVM